MPISQSRKVFCRAFRTHHELTEPHVKPTTTCQVTNIRHNSILFDFIFMHMIRKLAHDDFVVWIQNRCHLLKIDSNKNMNEHRSRLPFDMCVRAHLRSCVCIFWLIERFDSVDCTKTFAKRCDCFNSAFILKCLIVWHEVFDQPLMAPGTTYLHIDSTLENAWTANNQKIYLPILINLSRFCFLSSS